MLCARYHQQQSLEESSSSSEQRMSDDEMEEDRTTQQQRGEHVDATMALSATATQLIATISRASSSGDENLLGMVVRELASNSFRALDARFFAKKTKGLSVRVLRRDRWVSVADSGCGMTRGDLVNRLAAPGANRSERGDEGDWKDALAKQDIARLCNLGAGIFSVFAVANSLRVVTRNVDDEAYCFDVVDGKCSVRKATSEDAQFGGLLVCSSTSALEEEAAAAAVDGVSRRSVVCGTVVSFRLKDEYHRLVEDSSSESLTRAVDAVKDTSQYSVTLVDDDLFLLPSDDDDKNRRESGDDEGDEEDVMDENDDGKLQQPSSRRRSYGERAKYIPLRLSYGERKMLRLVEAAVKVSAYVDRVDAAEASKKPARRKQLQLQGVTGLLTGLVVAVDYEEGQRMASERNFGERAKFLRRCFEIARRYKILNPEKMRSEYGQLVYLLQDAAIDELRESIGVDLAAPVRTVYSLLRDKDGLALLEDPLVRDAASEVLPDPTKSRAHIQHAIKRKEHAVKVLGRRYASNRLSVEDIELCLCSICDNESYLNSNRLPIDQTLAMLREYFDPASIANDDTSLAISHGDSGARLSHSHARQFRFAEQSLSLWRAIVDDMFRLWYLAEADLLSGDAPYDLRDTGQGLQRVQACPRTYSAMLAILKEMRPTSSAQNGETTWVGSSMVHMGDHNVPNALTFLDKYAQVARILRPLVTILNHSIHLCSQDRHIKALVERMFGSVHSYRISVLHDFFRHAFDGSGADNFYDAGSCVDGRLTSAWNWCSQISQKPYYVVFKLAGFNGFDGDW